MRFEICFVISALFLFISIALSLLRYREADKNRVLSPLHILMIGVFLSAVALLFPLYYYQYETVEGPHVWFHAIISSLHNAAQLFTLDANPDIIQTCYEIPGARLTTVYAVLLSIEHIAAPILSAGFILSLFSNVTAQLRYLWHFRRNAFIFSELNDRSIALASSIRENERKPIIVFTDVSEKVKEDCPDLIDSAKALHAICLKKDILATDFRRPMFNFIRLLFSFIRPLFNLIGSLFGQTYLHILPGQRKLFFFVINKNETEGMLHSIELIRKYQSTENCSLYVFSSRAESDYLFSPKSMAFSAGTRSDKKITVRRVNDVTSLIYHNLYNEGYQLLYQTARSSADGIRKISAVIVGLGQYGTEMLKSLAWFCQMDGYQLQIDAFDQDPLIENKLTAAYPELMLPKFQGMKDDAFYQIRVHAGVDAATVEFAEAIQELEGTTYVLVSLGNDELNIRTAANIRMYFSRIGVTQKNQNQNRPLIQAIVYNSRESDSLGELSNFRNEPYSIRFFGGIEQRYTEDVMMKPQLEEDAKMIHRQYFPVDSFYDYEYFFRSSCAAAIHCRTVAHILDSNKVSVDSLEWADTFYKLVTFFCNYKPKEGDDTANALQTWAEAVQGILRILTNKVGTLNWDSLSKTDLFSNEDKDAWETERGIFNDIIRQCPETWKIEPSKYDAITETIDLDFLMKLRSKEDAAKGDSRIAYKNGESYVLLMEKLNQLEHRRWEAYMRTEGYIFSGSKERSSRFDLAKMHHDLTVYDELLPNEKSKDIHTKLLVQHLMAFQSARTVALARALNEGDVMPETVSITGKIETIIGKIIVITKETSTADKADNAAKKTDSKTAGIIDRYGVRNVTLKVSDSGSTLLHCRFTCKEAADLSVGDTITITGTLKNEKGVLRFQDICGFTKQVP